MSSMWRVVLVAGLTLGLAVPRVGHIRDAEIRYGRLRPDYSWPQRGKWIVDVDWIANGKRWILYLNSDVADSLKEIEWELIGAGLDKEIRYVWGCYSPRPVSGTSVPSVHAYGLGCDLSPGKGKHWSKEFIAVWKRHGWCWGGDFHTAPRDSMHFSRSWECVTHDPDSN